MKIQKYSTWLALPLVALFWVGGANAVSVTPGYAVNDGGSTSKVATSYNDKGEIQYFIPLNVADDEPPINYPGNYNGVYGVSGTSPCADGAGTCSDYGRGSRYATADALQMNLFFDTAAQPKSATAQLDIYFDDLDLVNVSDPMYFFESLSFSYWNSDTNSYSQIGGTIDETSELTSGAFSGAASTDLPLVPTPSDDPFTWSLDLAALGILDQVDDGFWIQLGFGSDFSGHKGRNTPEYLTAELTVSPVPLPSAVWLFGSALLGFIGMSRRTRV